MGDVGPPGESGSVGIPGEDGALGLLGVPGKLGEVGDVVSLLKQISPLQICRKIVKTDE